MNSLMNVLRLSLGNTEERRPELIQTSLKTVQGKHFGRDPRGPHHAPQMRSRR